MLEGEHTSAPPLYRESLQTARELGDQESIAYGLEGLAAVAGAESDSDRAARLYGAAEAVRDRVEMRMQAVDRPVYDGFLSAARSGGNDGVWVAACEKGREMSLNEAVAYALEGLEAGVAPVPRQSSRGQQGR